MDITEFGTIHINKYYGSLSAMLKRFDAVKRQSAFMGKDASDYEKWRQSARKKLKELLGLDRLSDESVALGNERYMYQSQKQLAGTGSFIESRIEERTELGLGIVREKVVLKLSEEEYIPMYILIPEKPRGVFLALPGHMGAGKYAVAGRHDIPAVKKKIELFNYDYGLKLAELGYTAVCPDCRGFGERRDKELWGDGEEEFISGSCRNLSNMAIPLGLSAIGLMVYDHMALIDYLFERGEWDLSNLGCLGFSGGGMQTLYLSALDDRIKRSVISGYFYGFRDSLLILNNNCPCNYVPGLWEHFDMGDILSMFAPKPVLIQSCEDDHLNGPRGLLNVTEQLEILKASYKLFGADDRISFDVRQGGHCFHSEPLSDFICKTETN